MNKKGLILFIIVLLTLISSIDSSEISGIVQLQGQENHSGLEITLVKGNFLIAKTYSDADGSYKFTNLKANTYKLLFSAPNQLLKVLTDINLSEDELKQIQPFKLQGGDANADETINESDYTILESSMQTMSGEPGYNPSADFNNDGRINMQDFSILASNRNKASDKGFPIITSIFPSENSSISLGEVYFKITIIYSRNSDLLDLTTANINLDNQPLNVFTKFDNVNNTIEIYTDNIVISDFGEHLIDFTINDLNNIPITYDWKIYVEKTSFAAVTSFLTDSLLIINEEENVEGASAPKIKEIVKTEKNPTRSLFYPTSVEGSGALAPEKLVFISNSGSNNISWVDVSTQPAALIHKFDTANYPVGLFAFPPINAERLISTNKFSNSISVYNILNYQTEFEVPISRSPTGIIFASSTLKLFVSNQGSDFISVIDMQTGEINQIPSPPNIISIALSEDENFLYAAVADESKVLKISLAPLIKGGDGGIPPLLNGDEGGLDEFPVGIRPVSLITFNNKLYVLNHGSNDLYIINETNYQLPITRIPLPSAPEYMSLSPSKNYLYITHSSGNIISIFDLNTGQISILE